MRSNTVGWMVVLSCALAFGAWGADKKTERLFNSKCGSCHGKDGKGQTEKGKKMGVRDMASAEYQKGTDAEFKKAIQDGISREKDGKKQEMDPYKEELSDADIDALIKLTREFK